MAFGLTGRRGRFSSLRRSAKRRERSAARPMRVSGGWGADDGQRLCHDTAGEVCWVRVTKDDASRTVTELSRAGNGVEL